MTIRVGRALGDTGHLYLYRFKAEKLSGAERDLGARIETIEGAYVDEDGAIAAVEQQISANYDGMGALAEATAFPAPRQAGSLPGTSGG